MVGFVCGCAGSWCFLGGGLVGFVCGWARLGVWGAFGRAGRVIGRGAGLGVGRGARLGVGRARGGVGRAFGRGARARPRPRAVVLFSGARWLSIWHLALIIWYAMLARWAEGNEVRSLARRVYCKPPPARSTSARPRPRDTTCPAEGAAAAGTDARLRRAFAPSGRRCAAGSHPALARAERATRRCRA